MPILLLAVLLALGCTQAERDNPNDPHSDYYDGIAELYSSSEVSSSSEISSSSVALWDWCIYPELLQCYLGSYSVCPAGGELSDFCPYKASSSSNSSSSNQGTQSSSSAAPEYGYCVFISDGICLEGPVSSCPPGGTLSNTCPYGSSSSVSPPSSSSVAKSSSSSVGVPIVSNCSLNGGTVNIGGQVWMAENLNCNVSGSKCYNNQESNCAIYGRLYDWSTAMALPGSCNSASNSTACFAQIQQKHRGICPSGWHIPNHDEWAALMDAVGGYSIAGRKLRAQSGWDDCGPSGSGNLYLCEDTYGFSALPGGGGSSGGGFYNVGNRGYWWSTTNAGNNDTYYRYIYYNYEIAYGASGVNKSELHSVRCLKDGTYTVTYDANGGSDAPTAQTKTHDVALTLSSTVPTKTNYAFSGWNTAAEGGGTSYAAGGSYTDNAEIKLYAQWVQAYTVTYDANGGSGAPAAQTKTHDVSLTLSSAVPTRAGYTFAGWNTMAKGGGSYAAGASYTANASVKLYAQWTIYGYPITYEGETYETVVIGTQTWMARNLNYEVEGSKCYDNDPTNCDKYGRLYNWTTAMALPDCVYGTSCASQIGAKHRGICPVGWHIPSYDEWKVLQSYIESDKGCQNPCSSKHLKSSNGWNGGTGWDSYGFSALPGGYVDSDGDFYGLWWSAEETTYSALCRTMNNSDNLVTIYYPLSKNNLASIRCLKDD